MRLKLGLGLITHISNGSPYLPETVAYVARIKSDLGTIPDDYIPLIDADIVALKSIGVWDKVYQYIVAYGGRKIDSTGGYDSFAKAYDVKSTKDLIQSTKINQPPIIFSGDEPLFDFGDGHDYRMTCAYGENIAQPYDRAVIVESITGTALCYAFDGIDSSHRSVGAYNADRSVRIYAGSAVNSSSANIMDDANWFLYRFAQNPNLKIFKGANSIGLDGTDIGNHSANGLTLGGHYSTATTYAFRGKINGFIQFKSNQVLTPTEITNLDTYLSSRFGLGGA